MLLALQDDAVAVVPLNVTVLLPWLERKFPPAITMTDPVAPVFGVRLLTEGTPVAKGSVICESKFPFKVPSRSSSPLKAVDEVAVKFTPIQR
jgi:hypothetical protein